MSTAFRKQRSGEGDEVGLLGATAYEVWAVVTDFESEDPLTTLEKQRPIGQRHPDRRFKAATVSSYLKLAKTTPNSWDILVTFRTPDQTGGGSWNGWATSSRIQSSTEPLGRALHKTNEQGRYVEPGDIIGPGAYRLAKEGENWTHETVSLATGDTVHLRPVSIEGVPATIPQPYNRLRHDLVLSFTRTVPLMTFQKINQLSTFCGRANNATWGGIFAPRTLMFQNWSMNEEGQVDDNGNLLTRYPVTVDLVHNSDGWTPIEVYDTRNDGGAVVPIKDIETGEFVRREFEVYDTFNMDIVFRLLDSTAPNGMPTRKP